jgi:hypothetical protein
VPCMQWSGAVTPSARRTPPAPRLCAARRLPSSYRRVPACCDANDGWARGVPVLRAHVETTRANCATSAFTDGRISALSGSRSTPGGSVHEVVLHVKQSCQSVRRA